MKLYTQKIYLIILVKNIKKNQKNIKNNESNDHSRKIPTKKYLKVLIKKVILEIDKLFKKYDVVFSMAMVFRGELNKVELQIHL